MSKATPKSSSAKPAAANKKAKPATPPVLTLASPVVEKTPKAAVKKTTSAKSMKAAEIVPSKPAKAAHTTSPVNPATTDAFITDYDRYLLQEGTHRHAFTKLGAHLGEHHGVQGTHFAVWAPNASRVSVVGDFNAWDGNRDPLMPSDSGIWNGFIPGVKQGALYKYELHNQDGHLLPLKADPYAFYSELPPATASVVWTMPHSDHAPGPSQTRNDPISIYEVHLASWRRGEDNRILTYRELAETLVPYVVDMGFTHLEFMPISEHPFSGSWGYQPIGLFAPTSRFGTPDDFRALVNAAHAAGLKVLIDWVPGHFPNDAHGLASFDGTPLYEHADPREGTHQDWDTLIYNFGRREVANLLLANATYWLECFGIDGLRVDAVASMIYRNYSRKEGEWVPNVDGGVENYEATSFLKHLNENIYGQFPDAVTIAEESTAWHGVSHPTYEGGLGFGFKWNMGWMHDTLTYMGEDPINRRYHHDKMTFGMIYAYTENFVLPLSHDEVVHGKGSIFDRMPGDEWQRFANLRAYYGFMFAHPGKKLLFMGNEFAQRSEWKHDYSLDWHLLENDDPSSPAHRGVQQLIRDLNHLYRDHSALYRHDCEPSGFEWLQSEAREVSIFAFARKGEEGDELIIAISNFTPVPRYDYRIGVPQDGFYRELLNTDAAIYGGSNVGNHGFGLMAEAVPHDGRSNSLVVTIPPLATVYFIKAAQ